MGEKLVHLAAEYGVERTALINRLKRRYSEEYEKLTRGKLISSAPSEEALRRRTAKLDEKWANHQSVLDYLHGNGTLQQIADKNGITLSAMQQRVQRALRHKRNNPA